MKISNGFRKVNFNQILEDFEKDKINEISSGQRHDWKMSNLKGRISRFRDAIVATKGLLNATKLTPWLNSYPQIRSAATRRNNLNLRKMFLNEYLCRAMAGNSSLVNFQVFYWADRPNDEKRNKK